jgi:transcriptional antiterminator RfaH
MPKSETISSPFLSVSYWYLATAKPRQESRAVENLENQQIQAFCPTVKVEKLRRGKKEIVTEALFTGYLFINLSPQDALWHKVRSTRGIRGWVRFAGEVAKIPDKLVTSLIQANFEPELQLVISHFNKGQAIRVLSGPFAGLKGIYDKEDGELRSMILVNFLGQTNHLKIPNEQIISD